MSYSAFKEWAAEDRGVLLALMAEERETCPQCGHLVSECRDPKSRGRWQVIEETCHPSVVAQAIAEERAEQKRRGTVISTRRTGV